jgi:acyl transferase domain-containing protein/NAD(P)H-dependent flavin oxidoreductase YrpB (nitropropane dioxygenase family)/NAD(P)-dependent dehydrogenase (short-subunit alcohol dehydrogenase family)
MTIGDHPFEVIAVSSANHLDPSIAIAAIRAGYSGVLDLDFADPSQASTWDALERLEKYSREKFGIKVRGADSWLIDRINERLLACINLVIVTPTEKENLRQHIEALRGKGGSDIRIFLEVVTAEEAALGEEVAADGLISKGNEAGGRVGDETAFILLQRLVRSTELPLYVHGGISLHTVAAAYVAGAAGVVLDHQLSLTRESSLPDAMKGAIARMDGSETICLGADLGEAYRLFARPDQSSVANLVEVATNLGQEADTSTRTTQWKSAVQSAVDPSRPETSVWVIGQDAAFAARLAQEHGSVCGVIDALCRAMTTHVASAKSHRPLAPGAPLAKSHGTRFPIVQGPMTRVSDRAAFAARVGQEGALPFLALALMPAPEVEELLNETEAAMGGRSWGVGILGFVSSDLREQQLTAIRNFRPGFALIAGGRPDQAMTLEEAGIPTYLHVPSPGLLKLFLESGAHRFVFEGRECGGHVGPRSSFVLWNQMIDVLLDAITPETAAKYHVLFAGGIHDALSASMVASTAAELAEYGCKTGVLLGTAYTVTTEAVQTGAVVQTFQEGVVRCHRTVLLESGPGHVTRCADTPFVNVFDAEKRRLVAAGEDPETIRDTLEHLNVGRLRIATKGIKRNAQHGSEPRAAKFVNVHADERQAEGLYMLGQVAAMRDRVVSISDLHNDIAAVGTARLEAIPTPQAAAKVTITAKPSQVAIVGMGCILPKAPDLQTYWENILGNVDAITEVPEDRWDWRRYFDPDPAAPDKIYSKWGGFIDEIPFDPLRYGIPPNSLKSIEPLHLLTLEVVRAALHDAGFKDGVIPDPELRRQTSVILGVGGGTGTLGQRYAVRSSLPALMDVPPAEVLDRLPEWTEDSFPGVLLNITAGRVANRFDTGGVNFTVDAACASSLTAVALAVRELEAGISDMVIVGGADSFQNPFDYIAFSKTRALSPRGKCRTFDATADGIAISEGVAIIVLRRVAEAEREGARIYAVIQAAAGSSDGRDKSLTAPRPEGQVLALERAYARANISPATVGLIEAHGTGTVVGDRAEVDTLKEVFCAAGAEKQTCGIGSVKSMIGHTKCTAGAAGLIKVAMALHHKVLPPTANVDRPNPEANFPDSPFYVLGETRPWITPADNGPRRAGVSAFGFGGTNFHVVLQEYDGNYAAADAEALRESWPTELLLWSAPSRDELLRRVDEIARLLSEGAKPKLRDLAYSLWLQYRPGDSLRLSVVASSTAELVDRIRVAQKALAVGSVDGPAERPLIRTLDPRGVYFSEAPFDPDVGVAFLFPGQGSQYPNMLRDLALHFPEVRHTFGVADAVLADGLPRRLSSFVFPPPAFSEEEREVLRTALTQTDVAQPAIGTASVAMLRLFDSFGLKADMAGGHSYGEYVALHYAGVMDEETLFALSHRRGRCMIEAAGGDLGTMASVATDADTVLQSLAEVPGVQVANRNAPDQTVIAGPRGAVQKAIEVLGEAGVSTKPLPVACGFHSSCVAPARDRFAEALAQVPLNPATLPVFSNTTASPYSRDPEQMLTLLSEHLVSPVNFLGQIRAMYDAGARIFIEVGPGSVLTGLVGRILKERPHIAVASDAQGRPGLVQLQNLLAQLTVLGLPITLDQLFRGRHARRVDRKSLGSGDAEETLPPTTWLINGGNARPLHEKPQRTSPSGGTAQLATSSTAALKVNRSDGTAQSASPVMTDVSAAAPPQAVNTADTGLSYSSPSASAGQVMLQYQRLMQRFLETQQQTMLAYLQSGAQPRHVPTFQTRAGDRLSESLPDTQTISPSAQATTSTPSPSIRGPEAESTAASVDRVSATDALLALVSERTGYPSEMLDLDLNVEADLGIDSIKRVEILGAFRKQFIPESAEDVRRAMEQVAGQKTLRGIIDEFINLLAARQRGDAEVDGGRTGSDSSEGAVVGDVMAEPHTGRHAPRFLMVPVPRPPTGATFHPKSGAVFLVTDDEQGTADRLVSTLRTCHARPVMIRMATATEKIGDDLFAVDLTDAEAVREFRRIVLTNGASVGGVFHCLPLKPGKPFQDFNLDEWRNEVCLNVKSLFNLAMVFNGDLCSSASPCVVAATGLGGDFAIDAGGDRALRVAHGGVPGLLKTLAKEWPSAHCKSIDFDAEASAETIADRLLVEAAQPDRVVEVGYRNGRRLVLHAQRRQLETEGPEQIEINSSSVILVTGGARGITAEVTLELSEKYQPTLILCGSSALPSPDEGQHIKDIRDPGTLKAALIEQAKRQGKAIQPAALEASYRQLLKDREIRNNLEALKQAGARVEYHQVDVRDEARFGALIDSAYEKYGRLDGVVHGAGIIEDKLIGDKTADSFDRVVETKAVSAFILSRKLRLDSLQFLIFFTSVAGRFGNRGQSDYGAVNEILSKLAVHLDRQWPGRVVAISWGPWDKAGMVSPEVKRQFARLGIEAIEPKRGRWAFDVELRFGKKSEAEVIWGNGPWATELDERAITTEAIRKGLPVESNAQT